jgi:hypothetical protein
MAYSLSDHVLRHHRPEGRTSVPPACAGEPPPAAGRAADSAERVSTLGEDAGERSAHRTTVAELRQQVDALESEREALALAVAELRGVLTVEDVDEALAGIGLPPLGELAGGGKEEIARVPDEPADSQEAQAGSTQEAKDPAEPERAVEAPAREPADESRLAGPADGASEATSVAQVNLKLLEVLTLLKQSLETAPPERAPALEVPPEVTVAIAREVAGRIQEALRSGDASLLELSLAGGGASSSAGESGGAYWTTERRRQPFRRIPLDDIQAVIDELARSS